MSIGLLVWCLFFSFGGVRFVCSFVFLNKTKQSIRNILGQVKAHFQLRGLFKASVCVLSMLTQKWSNGPRQHVSEVTLK